MKENVDVKFIFLLVFFILVSVLFFGMLYFKGHIDVSNQVKLSTDINCSIENKVPVSDSVAASIDINEIDNSVVSEAQIELEFTSNTKDTFKYELFLIEQNTDMRINANYVKICLFDEDGNIINYNYSNEIPTFADLKVSSSFASARRIYLGEFKGSGMKKYRLRIWLADDYFVGGEQKKFEVKIGANIVR